MTTITHKVGPQASHHPGTLVKCDWALCGPAQMVLSRNSITGPECCQVKAHQALGLSRQPAPLWNSGSLALLTAAHTVPLFPLVTAVSSFQYCSMWSIPLDVAAANERPLPAPLSLHLSIKSCWGDKQWQKNNALPGSLKATKPRGII